VGESADELMNQEKKVFYTTADDSSGANCLRKLRCGCFDPEYVFTTEAIKTSEWHCCFGGCCVRKNDSIDVDEIKDMALWQTCGPGWCLFDRGHFIIYFKEGNDPVQERHIWHIEGSSKIFEEYSVHVSKMNNLKFGMRRPETGGPDNMYDSKNDSNCQKCCRTFVCCGCCCFPNSTISKRHVATDQWTCAMPKGICGFCVDGGFGCCIKKWEIVDVDDIKDVTMERTCFDMCVGTGKIILDTPTDIDQSNGVTLKFVGNASEVYKQFDEFVNKLDNRGRIMGDAGMGR